MPKIPEGAKNLKVLASRVSGKQGRALAAAVDAALDGTPNLGIVTRLATSQFGMALQALGGYAGEGVVPIRTKKRMRKDPQLRFALAAAKSPITSAPLYFECRDPEVKALLSQVFIQSGTLHDLLDSSTNAVEYGFQNHEILWRMQEDYKIEWVVPGDQGVEDPKDSTRDVLYEPHTFKDLDPALVQLLWNGKGELTGSLFGSVSRFQSWGEVKESGVNRLAPEKMFLFTPIQESQNYYGEGQLDWAYDHWYWQNILYLIAMRWYERKADPAWVGYAPSEGEVVPDPDDPDDSLVDSDSRQDTLGAISRAMTILRSGGAVAIPSDVYMDENGKPSNQKAWGIDELETQDMHPAFLDMLDHLDKKKTRAIFVPDTVLSRDRQVASLGAVEAVTDVAVQIQNRILRRFIRSFNEQVLAPFLAYNGIKERATLVSPGVFSDNRTLLRDMILKAFEADMLIDQAGVPNPSGLTRTFDRRTAARAVGVPVIDPDPEAPPPKPLMPVPELAPGRDHASNNPGAQSGAKRGTGVGSTRKASGSFSGGGQRLDTASGGYLEDMEREAQRVEDSVLRRAEDAPARKTLSTTEQALIAIALWMLIRSRKKTADGKRIAGSKQADSLVWDGAKIKSPAALATAVPALSNIAGGFEGRNLTIDAKGSEMVLKRTQAAVTATMADMQQQIRTKDDLQAFVMTAVDQAQNSVQGIVERWTPMDQPFAALDPEEAKAIVDANVEGLLLNIDNIARRNAGGIIEGAIMAFATSKRLGLVSDALAFRFNQLYSDLTLEAHLRAAYRAGVARTAEKNGLRYMVKIPAWGPTESAGSQYDYEVQSHDWWHSQAEGRGPGIGYDGFGFHHGSSSYWYPVPLSERIRLAR